MNTKILRQKILDLAIRGKLTEQKKSDGTTKDLLASIAASSACHAELVSASPSSSAKKNSKATERSVILSKRNASKDLAKEIIPLNKDEAPFEIPENWEWVRLGDVCSKFSTGPFGTMLHQSDYVQEDGVPLINPTNIKNGVVEESSIKMVDKFKAENLKTFVLEEGDVVLARRGDLSKCAEITKNESGWLAGTGAFFLRTNLIENKFLLTYYVTNNVQSYLIADSRGSTMDNLNQKLLHALPVPLPPLAEQKRIVEAIESAFAEITSIENNQELLKKHIKQGRQKILDLAIRGKLTQQLKTDGTTKDLLASIATASACHAELVSASPSSSAKKNSKATERSVILSKRSASKDLAKEIIPLNKDEAPFEIPENWEWVKLGDVGVWQAGTTPSKANSAYYKDGTIPWLNTGDLTDGVVTEIPKMVTEKALAETSLKMNEAGSVCIAMYGATIGKLGILAIPATTNQACCVCNKRVPFVEQKWLFYFLMFNKQDFIEAGMGGAQPNISKEKIVSTYFPLPPLAEQQRIVAAIESAFAEFDAMEKL